MYLRKMLTNGVGGYLTSAETTGLRVSRQQEPL